MSAVGADRDEAGGASLTVMDEVISAFITGAIVIRVPGDEIGSFGNERHEAAIGREGGFPRVVIPLGAIRTNRDAVGRAGGVLRPIGRVWR